MGLVEFFKSSHCWVLFSASGRGEEPSSSGGRVSGWKLAEVKPVKILLVRRVIPNMVVEAKNESYPQAARSKR